MAYYVEVDGLTCTGATKLFGPYESRKSAEETLREKGWLKNASAWSLVVGNNQPELRARVIREYYPFYPGSLPKDK